MKGISVSLSLYIIFIIFTLTAICSCSRKPAVLYPFGWEATGKPSDSLLVLLDRNVQNYGDPDSLALLVKEYVETSKREDPGNIYEHRRLYWEGTSLFMHGEFEKGDSLRRLALVRCDSARFPHDYRLYRLVTEQPTDLVDNASWHTRYISDLKSFKEEGDLVSAFSRSVMLSQLMSETGMHKRALEYALQADSLLDKAGLKQLRANNRINVAYCQFQAGDTAGGSATLGEMKRDIGINSDKTAQGIIDYDIYRLNGDTASLLSAWRIAGENPDLIRLRILVAASMVESGLAADAYPDRKMYLTLLKEADRYAFLPEEDLRIKKAVCDLEIRNDDTSAIRKSVAEYGKAVERYLREQKKGEVIAAETAMQINDIELKGEREKQRSRNIMWGVLLAVGMAAAIATVCVIIYVNRSRRYRLLSQLEIERHRRKEMASSLALNEKERIVENLQRKIDRLVEEGELRKNFGEEIASAVTGNPVAADNDVMKPGETPEELEHRFINAYMREYPGVGKTGRRLALYIWKGMDTSEIAHTMNIRKESVMQSRWRLRSQMGLSPEEDLEVVINRIRY